MNDKDRDLIQQVLHAAGHAGEQGFTYLVRYKYLDGLTDTIVGVVILAFTVWAFGQALAWKPVEDDGYIARAALFVSLTIMGIVGLCVGLSGVVTMLAPEGAAIHSVLAK